MVFPLFLATLPATTQTTLEPGALSSLPFSRGQLVFSNRSSNDGKVVFCVQKGLRGKPRILLDSVQDPYLPKYSLDSFSVSDDGKFVVYFVPKIPHRYEDIRVLDVKTGKDLPDVISWTYVSDLAWRSDGFIYGRYPKPEGSDDPSFAKAPSSANDHLNEKLYFHKMGTSVSSDHLVYEDPEHPKQKYLFLEDFGRRWLHVHIFPASFPLTTSSEWFAPWKDQKLTLTAIQPELVPGQFYLCDDTRSSFVLFTLFKSPRGRIILVDARNPSEEHWKTLVPETAEKMVSADPAAGKLTLTYKTATGGSRVEIRSWNGKFEKLLPIPAGEEADVQWSGPSEKVIFYSLKDANLSKRYFSYEVATGKVIPLV